MAFPPWRWPAARFSSTGHITALKAPFRACVRRQQREEADGVISAHPVSNYLRKLYADSITAKDNLTVFREQA